MDDCGVQDHDVPWTRRQPLPELALGAKPGVLRNQSWVHEFQSFLSGCFRSGLLKILLERSFGLQKRKAKRNLEPRWER